MAAVDLSTAMAAKIAESDVVVDIRKFSEGEFVSRIDGEFSSYLINPYQNHAITVKERLKNLPVFS
jgi:hypothetical protein